MPGVNARKGPPAGVVLRLESLEQLLVAPPAAADGAHPLGQSGVDQIRQACMGYRALAEQPLAVEVRMPNALPDAASVERARIAVAAFCQAHQERLDARLRSVRLEARAALKVGFAFLAVCMMLSGLCDTLTVLPEFPRRLFREGFLIGGWVALWRPVELILYAWWPHVHERNVYRRMARMSLRVTPEVLADGARSGDATAAP